MQDRQARNRDPFSSSEDSSDSAWEGQSGKFNVYVSLHLIPKFALDMDGRILAELQGTCSRYFRGHGRKWM